jgi:hypothetical protein
MSNDPLNNNNGNLDGNGGDWRQHQPRIQGSHDNIHIQPPPVPREALPLPPPLPQRHVPGYHNQAILRQQAVSPVSLNQPQQRQNAHGVSNFYSNIDANHQSNFSATMNVDSLNSTENRTGVGLGMGLDPEEQLGGDDNNDLYSNTFHTSITGWSEVDSSGGGIPPSARSLHSAALLNGVMYVFGTLFHVMLRRFQWIHCVLILMFHIIRWIRWKSESKLFSCLLIR